MSSVTPPSGGNSLPPITFSSVGGNPNVSQQNLVTPDSLLSNTVIYDTLLTNFSEQPAIIEPKMSLSEFFQIIHSAISESVKNQKTQATQRPLNDRNLNISIAQNAAILLSDLIQISKFTRAYNQLTTRIQNAIDAMNQAIGTYNQQNGPDQDAIDALNLAIAAYNQDPSSQNLTALHDAISTYNDYQTQRGSQPIADAQAFNAAVAAYASKVDAFNAEITQINVERVAFGLPPITLIPVPNLQANVTRLPNAPDLPQPPPIHQLANTNISHYSQINFTPDAREPLSVVLNTYYAPLVKEFQAALNRIKKKQGQYFSLYQLITFLLPNARNPYVANTFNSYVPPDSSSSTGAGGGGSVGNMLTNLDPGQAMKALNNGMTHELRLISDQNQMTGLGNVHPPSDLLNFASLFGLEVLGKSALISVIPSLSVLGEQSARLGKESTALNAAYSLAFASNVFATAGTDEIKLAFLNFIKQAIGEQYPGAESLANKLAAAFKLSFLQIGLANIAGALGLPGLVPQSIANIAELTPAQLQRATSPNATLGETLRSQTTLAALGANAASTLSANGYSNEEAQSIAESAIAETLPQLGRFASNSDIRHTLESEFIAAGVDGATSRQIVNQALETIQANQQTNNNAEAGVAAANFNLALVNQDVLKNSIATQLKDQAVQNLTEIINAVETNLAKASSISSQLELRENIRQTLRQEGVNRTTARDAASGADIQFTNQQKTNREDALKTAALDHVLTPEEISTQLKNAVTERLHGEIGNNLALNIGARLENVVIGEKTNPESFLNQGLDAIKEIRKAHEGELATAYIEDFRQGMRPNEDLTAVANNVGDPANNLRLSVMTGLMYERALPSNFDKSRGMMV